MTRLFACICNQPEQLACALQPIRELLVAAAPVPRWGLGHVQSHSVLLSHSPRKSDRDVDFFAHVEHLRTDYLIAHAAVEDGLSGTVNTQPFRYRQWLFAQEYTVPNTADQDIDEAFAPLIPAFLHRLIRGKAVAEYVFYAWLGTLHAKNLLDAVDPPHDTLRSTLERTLSSIRSRGVLGLGNLVWTNGRSLMAVRLGLPLFMRRLSIDRYDAHAHSFSGVLVLSNDRIEHPGFEEIPSYSMLLSHRDLRTEILQLSR